MTFPTIKNALNKSEGFTLIEALVVITVISLLTAVLLPALMGARLLAQRARCSSNLRQIALAWDMYLLDHSDMFFQGRNGNVNYGGWIRDLGYVMQQYLGIPMWPRPLNPYANVHLSDAFDSRNAKVFCCPADEGGMAGYQDAGSVYDLNGNSYNANIYLIGDDQVPVSSSSAAWGELHTAVNKMLPNMSRKKVTYPQAMVALAGDYGWHNQAFDLHLSGTTKRQVEWHRKPDTYNMVFMDGHVTFTRIRAGYCYVDGQYYVLPFKSLRVLANNLHKELESGP